MLRPRLRLERALRSTGCASLTVGPALCLVWRASRAGAGAAWARAVHANDECMGDVRCLAQAGAMARAHHTFLLLFKTWDMVKFVHTVRKLYIIYNVRLYTEFQLGERTDRHADSEFWVNFLVGCILPYKMDRFCQNWNGKLQLRRYAHLSAAAAAILRGILRIPQWA